MNTPDHTQAMLADLGRQLAARRKAAGYLQRELGKRTGYSRTAIANAETGHTSPARQFWLACDDALDTGGTLTLAYALPPLRAPHPDPHHPHPRTTQPGHAPAGS